MPIQTPRLTGLQKFHLSPRELEALLWEAEGMTEKQSGRLMGISPRTVKTHRERAALKLGVFGNNCAVVTQAFLNGVIIARNLMLFILLSGAMVDDQVAVRRPVRTRINITRVRQEA